MSGFNTFGPEFNEVLDGRRIRGQIASLLTLMQDGEWRTLHEISLLARIPESSASADLRHLRKQAFGSWQVMKRRRTTNCWEYAVRPPLPKGQIEMFREARV